LEQLGALFLATANRHRLSLTLLTLGKGGLVYAEAGQVSRNPALGAVREVGGRGGFLSAGFNSSSEPVQLSPVSCPNTKFILILSLMLLRGWRIEMKAINTSKTP